ncbi:MAG: hypothetical protein RCG15_03770 [Candidatus Rickettsia vulgarisii]
MHNISLPDIPKILPSELLERRPDIAQNERLVAKANAQVGILQSSYFPIFNLNASTGLEGFGSRNLISLPILLWSVGPQLTNIFVFDGG